MGFFECYGRQVEGALLDGQSHRDIVVDIADVLAMMKENTNDVNSTSSAAPDSTTPNHHPRQDGIMPRGTLNFQRQVGSATRGSLRPEETESTGPTQHDRNGIPEGNFSGWNRSGEEAGEEETPRHKNMSHWVGRGRKVDVHLAKVVLDGNEQQVQGWETSGSGVVGESV